MNKRLEPVENKIFKEIGGNFWFEPKEIEKKTKKNLIVPHLKKYKDVAYVSSGRGAISLILEQIVGSGGTAILPEYICHSVIIPFEKHGYNIFYYKINKDLSINFNHFIDLVKKHKPNIVYTNSYFGFNTLNTIKHEYQRLKNQGITIIEDITHSWFSHFKKNDADYYLASLRKWLGLPDGGVAISTRNKIKFKNNNIHKILVEQNIKASIMKYEYTKNLDATLKNEFRKIFYSSEDLLDKDCGVYPMSTTSKGIFYKTDFEQLSADRRSNYLYLQNYLKHIQCVTPIFKDLPKNVVPLYFPVYVSEKRNKLQKYLADDEIYAPIHWPIPREIETSLTKTSIFIYNNILSIPCDQRYSNKNLERILTKLSNWGDHAKVCY